MDYWDRLGWRDKFGSPEHTARQKRYAKRHMGPLYTPQLIVNNDPSSGKGLVEAVKRESAKKPKLAITATATLDQGKVHATIRIKKLDPNLALDKDVGVIAILVQKSATTECVAGENKGKTLVEHFNVLKALEPTPFAEALSKGVQVTFDPKNREAKNLAIVVLVEDRLLMKTHECASFPVKVPPKKTD